MTVIDKTTLTLPVRRRETVLFPPFGEGVEVVIQQITLDRYMHNLGRGFLSSDGMLSFAQVLSECVLDVKDKPVFTAAEWDSFGASHLDETMVLYRKVRKLSGLDQEEAAKN